MSQPFEEISPRPLKPALLELDGISRASIEAHYKLYQGYVAKRNEILGKLGSAELADANQVYSDVRALKEQVTQNGVTRFGSGWSWVVWNGSALEAYSTANQDSPLMEGHTPIFGVDVWEHAYYLRYQNRRPDYLAAWWDVVDWNAVAAKLDAAR